MKSTHEHISLVLGSGGARGLAHIGIIRWLEEHDSLRSPEMPVGHWSSTEQKR